MAATRIDGAALAAGVRAGTTEGIARLKAAGRPVRLVAVLVGATPAAELYAARQADGCRAIGIDYTLVHLAEDLSNRDLRHELRRLSHDPAVTGIMLHLPLPHHIDLERAQYEIDVVKDVEGVSPANLGYVLQKRPVIAPCTATAAVELIESTGVPIEGAEAVVVGASPIVGKPVALLLLERLATVSVCHIATRDLGFHTRRADILVVAAGKAGLIGAGHVKAGACVIDVGINRVSGADGQTRTVGDVDYDAVNAVAGHLTPVPGGVGPMTVAVLLRNTLRAAQILAGVTPG